MEKAAALKQVDNRIIALKRDINKLKDLLGEYGNYEVTDKIERSEGERNIDQLFSYVCRGFYTPCHRQRGDNLLRRKPVSKQVLSLL